MARAPKELWPPTFAAAIFDFDGTLADTAHLWYEVDVAWLSARGLPYDPSFPREISALGFEDGARYAIERFGLDEKVQDICDEWNRMGRERYQTRVTLRPGARAYLDALRERGIPVALATTNDPDVLASMRANVDVYALFDAVVCGNEVAGSKREPDIYLEAARRLGAEPAGCVVFEDLAEGLAAARAAGMLTCGVLARDHAQDADEVRAAADLLLDSWEDIDLSC